MTKTGTTHKWYALYTKPRWEKKVNRLLNERGIESYCPLNIVRRKWSDRYKMVEEPLFKSYVFVKIQQEEQSAVRLTPGVINFVYWQGKPAIVKENEVDAIKKYLNEYNFVYVEPIPMKIGQQVIIQSGIFMDQVGDIADIRHKKIIVRLSTLGVNLVVSCAQDNLKFLPKN
ncbi:transcription termination/antitermination protein NusG [Pseudoflavitalea rhizosphaerae]|uniref:transcription termination/antitermination protein NusG n=1 Tax=Pseudoflavitalea rhizosphaerae TaxID=1884793 RepID=UPI000F8F22D1|nr:UpxY family transcription antiterminator [Pseudoflavitalea rhizosphaerae]